MNKGFLNTFIKEWHTILHSPYRIIMLFIAPLLTFAIIIAIFYKGVVRDLPIAVVDEDKSTLSKDTLFAIDASPSLHIAESFDSLYEASNALKDAKVYAIIVIPEHFEENIYKQNPPKITLFVNAQFILIGKSIAGELEPLLLTLIGESAVGFDLIKSKNLHNALGEAAPLQIQSNYFFNAYKNYSLFLVSALVPAIWQIFVMISALIAVGETYKQDRVKAWLEDADERLFVALSAKILPYTLSMFAVGTLFLLYLYAFEPWPVQGSWGFLLLSLFVTTLAYQAMALLLFTILFDYATAVSLCAFYAAPAFAFIGITYPQQNMAIFASIWHELLPISHYMQIQVEQTNYGSPLLVSLSSFYALLLFFIVGFGIAYVRFKTTLKCGL